MKIRTKLCLLPLLAIVATGLASCNNEQDVKKPIVDDNPSQKLEKIKFYGSGPKPMYDKLEEVFEKENGDVVDITNLGCGALRDKIKLEVQNNNIVADVFFGSNEILFNNLRNGGHLVEYKAPNAKEIKDTFKYDHNYYFPVSARYQVCAYNKEKFGDGKDLPQKYLDITKEDFDYKYVWTNPTTSSTAFALAAGLRAVSDNTMSFFEKIQKKDTLFVGMSSQVIDSIQEQKADIGICPSDAFARKYKFAAKNEILNEINYGMHWTEDAIRIERPIAILNKKSRSEGQKNTCQKLVNFMLSKKAQTIMANFGFHSTINNVDAPKGPKGYFNVPKNIDETCTIVDWKAITPEVQKSMTDTLNNLIPNK